MTLASHQLPQQVDFYSQLLSLVPLPNTPTYAEFQLPGMKLAIFVPSTGHAAEFARASGGVQRSGPMSLCLEVEDLPAAIARLTQLGYPPPGEIIRASHGQEIYAYDPDGNRLILHQGLS